MGRVKQQHFVPRFYLRRFANADEQIHVFDKHEVRSFFTNIQNVAAEQSFLDIPGLEADGISKQFMETEYLPIFEAEGRQALEELLGQLENGTFRRLRGARRKQIVRYFVIQFLRTKEQREALAQLYGRIEEENAREFLARNHPDLASENFTVRPAKEAEPLIHALFLLNLPYIEAFTRVLLKHLCLIYEAPAETPFWTSDNPVVRRSDITGGMWSLNDYGVQIALPLSPRFLLTLGDAEVFHFMTPHKGRLLSATPENVLFYNSLQLIQATRFVYASCPDFSMAEEMCREHERLRDPDRPRLPSAASVSSP